MSGSAAMQIQEAQEDLRLSYFGGAPGMLVSAAAWFASGLSSLYWSNQRAVFVLFVGGMLIHPLSTILTKALGRSAKHVAGNPLGRLAQETTVWLILCLPLAFVVSRFNIDWFFPAMLLVISGRYTVFATMFGSRTYWACAAALAVGAYLLFKLGAGPATGAFTGATIEAVFSIAIFSRSRSRLIRGIVCSEMEEEA
jgi:hypothetical protein